jgi:hypothetical protein
MSGSIQVQLGNAAPLRLQLPNTNNTAGVKASVYDSTNTEITGSPFVIPFAANGLYSNLTSWTPAAIGNYYATYTVYKDATYSVVDTRYARSTDYFDVDQEVANENSSLSNETALIAAVASVKSDTSSTVNAIQALSNAQGFALPLPPTITIPSVDVGSERIRVPFTIYRNGANADVDAGTFVICTLVDQNGIDHSTYLLGNSGGTANATHLSLGNYYIDISIPPTAPAVQLTLMLAYYLSSALVTRTGVTQLVQGAGVTGYALQSTALDIDTKVTDIDTVLNDANHGNAALATQVAGVGTAVGVTHTQLTAIAQTLAQYLHTGGRMVN